MVYFDAENCLLHRLQRDLLIDEVAAVVVSLQALRQPKLRFMFVPENEGSYLPLRSLLTKVLTC